MLSKTKFTLLWFASINFLTNCKQQDITVPLSVAVEPIGTKLSNSTTEGFKPANVKDLLVDLPMEVLSSTKNPVPEPEQLSNTEFNFDDIGYGKSKFLVNTRWATIRYLGDNPAGAGLSGTQLNDAQRNALGLPNDSIPVITIAWTVNKIISDYFSILLQSTPTGKDILAKIKVQGVWIAPDYIDKNGDKPRDNALIIGLKTLKVFPSSCFEKQTSSDCKTGNFYSAGHDPTVIGHEIGHVIFNHLRGKKSLDGFQWFSVNEGYADYFSSSFFSEPQLGRIWKVNAPTHNYLRDLQGTPKANEADLLEEGHLYSTVWSSSLWRARTRSISELKLTSLDFDKVILKSILYLGETEKPGLGDSVTAVLKSAELSSLPSLKKILREEFDKAAIEYTTSKNATNTNLTNKPTTTSAAKRGLCGVIAKSSDSTQFKYSYFIFFTPLLVLFIKFSFSRKSKRSEKA